MFLQEGFEVGRAAIHGSICLSQLYHLKLDWADDQEIPPMDGSSRRCDQLQNKSERLIRFSSEHDDGRGSSAGHIYQLCELLRYSGIKLMLALIHGKLRSIRLTFNQPSTLSLLAKRAWEFPSVMLGGRSAIIRRHVCL